MAGDGRKANRLWSDAAREATAQQMPQSAADWLSGKQVTHRLFWMFEIGNTDHLVIQALRAGENEPSLTGLYRPERLVGRALSEMFDERWRGSLAPLRRLLKHTVTTADMAGEFEAHERLGDLYANTDRWRQSLGHYSLAGRTKKVRELAASLPDQPISLNLPAQNISFWETQSWLEFASVAGPLMDDSTATEWADFVFKLLQKETKEDGVSRLWEASFTAFPALADAVSPEVARAYIDYAHSRLNRPKGENHTRDKELLKAVIAVASVHTHLKDEALNAICRAVLLGDITGAEALRVGAGIIHANPEHARELLADSDPTEADEPELLGRLFAEDTSERLRGYARERWSRAIEPKKFTPGQMSVGTNLRQSAQFVTLLHKEEQRRFAEAMLVRARDERDDANNRDDALVALAIMGPSLRGEAADLVDTLVDFACGPVKAETIFDWSTDPLAYLRTTSSTPPLAAQALETAGTLASEEEQFIALKRAILHLLPHADKYTYNRLAAALCHLPAELFQSDLPLLAVHTDLNIRAASAVLWARASQLWPSLGEQLASDPEPAVRRALACKLGDEPLHGPVKARLREDHRRDVRSFLLEV